MAYTLEQGYTVEDLLHFGYGHVDAARSQFKDDPAFLDSAGYVMHLGVELIPKAWHLLWFRKFENTHDLIGLFAKLKGKDNSIDIGGENEKFLRELDQFYRLRYPRRKEGAVEVGTDQLEQIDALLDALWNNMPDDLVETYKQIDQTKKSGRILMRKKVMGDESPNPTVETEAPQAARPLP